MTEINSAAGAWMNVSTPDQKHLVIVGATGMVGGYALRYGLDHPTVGSVISIGRKKLGISHPKLFCIKTSQTAPHSQRSSRARKQPYSASARIRGRCRMRSSAK